MASRGSQQKRIYALYRGDQYICDGTVRELAQELGIKFSTAQYYATKQHRVWADDHGSPDTIILDPIGWIKKKRNKKLIESESMNYSEKVFTHEQKLFEKYLERVFIDHNENIIQTIIYCNSNPGKMHHEERLAYRSLTISEINQVVNRITK